MTTGHALRDLLGELPNGLESWLNDRLQPVDLRAGERLFHEGDEGDSLYLVAAGRLQATRVDAQGASRIIGELGRAEPLGEMALLTDEPRSATIHAIRDSRLLRLSAQHFVELISENPQVLRPISEQLIRRLRSSPTTISSPASTVALIPLGSGTETLDLATELAAVASARGMDVEITTTYDPEVERSRDLLIMQPPDDIAAIEHCAANADRILFVASDAHIQQSLIDEVALRCPLTRRDLVMLHPEGRRAPRGTNRVSERVRPHRIHHVRLTDGHRVDGLLRSILEQEIVLVLSGGGARGLAHVGVCKAARERGIPIDAVIGTSAGSMVGAMIAQHVPIDEMSHQLETRIGGQRAALDFTAPAVSLASGRKITTNLRDAFGGACIEDTWTTFACVSTNLSRACPHVHDSGELWWAVRSSIAVPGVFPPTTLGTDVLVDGGIINNLPVDIARHHHPGALVISVDVGNDRELDAGDLPDHGVVSGWSIMARKLNPFARSDEVQGLLSILMRVTELGAVGNDDRGDLVIEPDVAGFGLFDFGRLDDLIEAGYQAASAAFDNTDLPIERQTARGARVPSSPGP